MQELMNAPFLIFGLSLLGLLGSTWIGANLRKRYPALEADGANDFGLILGATLTLLGLIIGFTFSMAIGRYEQRKSYEEEEANAIGTEYIRADLLPGDKAREVRRLLGKYLDQRILFFEARDGRELAHVNAEMLELQNAMWSAVSSPALAQPTPVTALAVSGMNDVLNAQGYTQAAWWNRIPVEAWWLMGAIAVCSNLLLGYGVRRAGAKGILYVVLPLTLSISFCLIADIDSPRAGLIRITPQNLLSLSQSLQR